MTPWLRDLWQKELSQSLPDSHGEEPDSDPLEEDITTDMGRETMGNEI